jgi:hypothetical protein
VRWLLGGRHKGQRGVRVNIDFKTHLTCVTVTKSLHFCKIVRRSTMLCLHVPTMNTLTDVRRKLTHIKFGGLSANLTDWHVYRLFV